MMLVDGEPARTIRLTRMAVALLLLAKCQLLASTSDTRKNLIEDTSNLVESKNLVWQLLKSPKSNFDKKTNLIATEKFSGKSLTSKFEPEILGKSSKIASDSLSDIKGSANSLSNHNKTNLPSSSAHSKTGDFAYTDRHIGSHRRPVPQRGKEAHPSAHPKMIIDEFREKPKDGGLLSHTPLPIPHLRPFLQRKGLNKYPDAVHYRSVASPEDPFRLTDIFHDENFNKLLSTDSSSFIDGENKSLQSFRTLHSISTANNDAKAALHTSRRNQEDLKNPPTAPLAGGNGVAKQSNAVLRDSLNTETPLNKTPKEEIYSDALPLPIYEEISGVLHIDTSIDDIADEFSHSKTTENNDQYLPPMNGSYTNLLEPELRLISHRSNVLINQITSDVEEGTHDQNATIDFINKLSNIARFGMNISFSNQTTSDDTSVNNESVVDDVILSHKNIIPSHLNQFFKAGSDQARTLQSKTAEDFVGSNDQSNLTIDPFDPFTKSQSNMNLSSLIPNFSLKDIEDALSGVIQDGNGSDFLIEDKLELANSNLQGNWEKFSQSEFHETLSAILNDSSIEGNEKRKKKENSYPQPELTSPVEKTKRNSAGNTTPSIIGKNVGALRLLEARNEAPSSSTHRNSSNRKEVALKNGDSENLYYSLFGYNNDRQQRKHDSFGDKITVESHNKMVLEAQAERMLLVMNQSADPCSDFYEYACGKWSEVYPLEDKALDNTFDRLREGLDEVLKSLLEEPINAGDSSATIAAKILYRGCLNMEEIENHGTKPLLSLLQELGGWPVLEGPRWDSESFDWVVTMAKLRTYNNDVLLSEWVAADITNSSHHIIQLDQPELGLPSREYFLSPGDEQYRKAYLELMLKSCELLGADPFAAFSEMIEVIDFEKEVAQILTPAEERRNLSAVHKRFTLEGLQREIPEIDWKTYISIVANEQVDQVQEVIVFALEYIKKLVFLVQTSKRRTVSNYLIWRFVKNRISNLGEDALEAKQSFIQTLFGSKSRPERWLACVSYVNGNLGYVVGALFVKKYYPASSKNDSEEMISLIRESFTSAIDEAMWMHERTRDIAIDKVDAMVRNVGYPEYILNDTYMDSIYSQLDFKEDTHFWNVIEMLKFHASTTHQLLLKPVKRTEWTTTPAVVNAYYSRSKNMIMFPAGILQPPFYHPAFPRCLNFGGVGVVIGHEISHGFDDRGRQFDRDGNLQQWWTKRDVSQFYDRATCMLVQYGEYEVKSVGLHINSVNTLSENIADNAGLKIAYKAYQRWKSMHPEEEVKLPNISLTHDQLFFLNFGQIWCEVNSPEAMLTKLRGGQHSPNKFRVIGTLSNSEEFSAAFNCPADAPMNPKEKCRVW